MPEDYDQIIMELIAQEIEKIEPTELLEILSDFNNISIEPIESYEKEVYQTFVAYQINYWQQIYYDWFETQ